MSSEQIEKINLLRRNKREQVKSIALAAGFQLKPQPDGSNDFDPHVYELANALQKAAVVGVCGRILAMSEQYNVDDFDAEYNWMARCVADGRDQYLAL